MALFVEPAAKTGRDAVARKAADDAVIGIVNTMVANAFKVNLQRAGVLLDYILLC